MKSEDARFEDDFEKIMRWYRDETRYPLTESLLGRLTRWKYARTYKKVWRPLTDSDIVDEVMRHFTGVSEPQAWRDVRDMKRFFASMEKSNKEFDRIMLIADIRDLRAKAELKGNLKVCAQCDATLAKLGVGEEVVEESNVGKTINLVIGFNPKLVGAKPIPNLLQIVEKFIGEKAKRELMIEDTDFVDIDGKRAD